MGLDNDYCKALYLNQESMNFFSCYHALTMPTDDMMPGIFTVDEIGHSLYTIDHAL